MNKKKAPRGTLSLPTIASLRAKTPRSRYFSDVDVLDSAGAALSLDALSLYELSPFAQALSAADGVMVAHISYPKIDDEHIASQSEVFITGILRGSFHFDGIVMSDDFRMAGLRKQTSLKDAAVQFIRAGGDLILCGANHSYQKQILEGLYEAVERGALTEERLNESVYRILSAKIRVTGWDPFEN